MLRITVQFLFFHVSQRSSNVLTIRKYYTYDRLVSEGHSTEHTIAQLVDKSTNHLKTVIKPLVFLSFNTVYHAILLKKLEIYEIMGANLALFRSYLTNGKQHIDINNENEMN